MEVKDVVISVIVPLVAALMLYFGSRRGTKVSREEFENRKEATPPELLRLEKWSTILKDSSDYPENIKHELDINAIQSTYNDIITFMGENGIKELGYKYNFNYWFSDQLYNSRIWCRYRTYAFLVIYYIFCKFYICRGHDFSCREV